MATAYSTTENGALSLNSTNDPRLNLFFKTVRDLGKLDNNRECEDNEKLYILVDESMNCDKLDTVKILFNWRDCRGGKGDKQGFLCAMVYLELYHSDWFYANIDILPEYGSYMDLVKLWHFVTSKKAKKTIMRLIIDALLRDKHSLECNGPISLVAKWIPAEGSKWDKRDGKSFVYNMCSQMYGVRRVSNEILKRLRKEILVPLRTHMRLAETKMCARDFGSIDYTKVPSVAMNKYKQAFFKNDKVRFQEYLLDVKAGKKKINSDQVYPHDLVRQYLNNSYNEANEVIEAQWNAIKTKVHQSNAFNNSICVVDVSGSMDGTPIEVAIALGLLGLYDDKVITFSENPQLFHIPSNDTLYEQVQQLQSCPWGMNTNFEKVMYLVLGLSSRKPENAIKRIFVFSDMQFDTAFGNSANLTHFELMKNKFETAGIEMPQLVFWNLRGNTGDFPVRHDDKGVVLMSGYSPSLMNGLLEGKDVTPMDILRNVLDNKRYDLVKKPDYPQETSFTNEL